MDDMMMDEEAAMMMDAPEEAAEGGHIEKSSHLEKSSQMSRATSRKSKKSNRGNGKHSSNSARLNQSASAAPCPDQMSNHDDETSLQSLRDAISDQMEAEVQRRNSAKSETYFINNALGTSIVHVTIPNEYPPMKDF